jgi:Tol biopolymer transport system component
MMTSPLPRRTAVALAGLGVLALTTTGTSALAASEPERPYNEHVALTTQTQYQLDYSSYLAGAGQAASHDGIYVVFETAAPLVPGDDNEVEDVYLRDFSSDVTVLVSSRKGEEGNDISSEPTISADGRYVAFTTWSTNLVKNDTNGSTLDVVVKDMQTDTITLASVTNGGKQKDGSSQTAVISDDGSSVSFQSHARLVRTDVDNHREDVYVRDLEGRRTYHVSRLPNGKDIEGHVGNGDIAGTGDVVVFGNANNLWWHDVPENRTIRFWHEPDEPPCQPNPTGSAGRPAISGNGRYAAFASCAVALPGEDGHHADVYRMRLRTGEITRVHKNGNGDSFLPSLSRSGRYVGFASEASDLVASDDAGMPDAFFADTETGEILRASEAPDGTDGDNWSATTDISISGDGRTLVYTSYAHNLIQGDAYDKPEAVAWRR